jgi:flavin-dependent dehydrogenase
VFDADVVVVGAGPGGCAAATAAARAGLRVLILEGQRFPRLRPGETLHPGVEPVLRRLGVAEQVLEADFLRQEGHWVAWDGPPRFVPYGSDGAGPWRGFQAWRARFDALLLAGACRAGARLLQPCTAIAPCVEDGRVRGVVTNQGIVRGRCVVDGTGGRRWLARQLGLTSTRPATRLIAWYGYVVGECPQRDATPALVADDTGWTWTARVRPHVYQWTRLTFRPRRLVGWLPPELRGLRPTGRARAADVSWRCVDAPAGPGYFLVGDAAMMLDPSSSHGVLRALLSGLAAGRLMGEVLRGIRPEPAAADGYGRWLCDWFMREVAALKEFYARLPHPPPWSEPELARAADPHTSP